MSMLPSILYCTPDGSVGLFDIPASLADAQKSSRQLRSTSPLLEPHQTPEPKGAAREKWLNVVSTAQQQRDETLQRRLTAALQLLHDGVGTHSWCLARQLYSETAGTNDAALDAVTDMNVAASQIGPPTLLSCAECQLRNDDITTSVVSNPHLQCCQLSVARDRGHGVMFYIPPRAVFLHCTIEHGRERFREAVKCLLPALPNQSHAGFDLVLLDPPWTNRSVRHSHAYSSQEHQKGVDPFAQCLPIIQSCLKADGIVAIWITNSQRVQNLAKSSMEQIQLQPIAEWIWLKTTSSGKPVTPLEGLWRKPYEVLLFFSPCTSVRTISSRVVCAVPDVHSRKPHLKAWLEEILPREYNALEIFARSLTAGWWSWGDEVLKFQRDCHWA